MQTSIVKQGYTISNFTFHICGEDEQLPGAELLEDAEYEPVVRFYVRLEQEPSSNYPKRWFVLLGSPYPVEFEEAMQLFDEQQEHLKRNR